MSVNTIQGLLTLANGRMRERTLDLDDVCKAIEEAAKGGWGWVTGGMITVKSYKYQANSVACAAIKIGKHIYIRIATINAKGSPVTWWGPHSMRNADIEAWVTHMRTWPLNEFDMLLLDRWTRINLKDVRAARKAQGQNLASQ